MKVTTCVSNVGTLIPSSEIPPILTPWTADKQPYHKTIVLVIYPASSLGLLHRQEGVYDYTGDEHNPQYQRRNNKRYKIG
jgi:hypothetical protein